MGTLRLERDGAVARVTLARPEVRNAFNAEMIADLHEALGEPALDGGGAAVSSGAHVLRNSSCWVRVGILTTRSMGAGSAKHNPGGWSSRCSRPSR